MMDTAVFSGMASADASWLMMSFSLSSSTPSASAMSTAQANAVSLSSSESSSAEAFTSAPVPCDFNILNSLSNSLLKAWSEKLSYMRNLWM